MVQRYQYPARVEGRPPTIPDFGWNVAQPDIIRPRHPVAEGWLSQSLEPITVAVPDFAWYNQYPEQVIIAKPSPYYYPSTEFRTELPPTVTLGQWWQPASEPVRTIPPIQQGLIAFLDIEDVSLVAYSAAGWPFLALINPADYPTGTQFFFEVILATDNAGITTSARLFNITDAVAVADSVLSTAVTGLGDRLRTGAAITLASGDKEYRAERGDAVDTSHARLYEARIVVVTPS
jgi:hypothetical protein